MYALIAQRSIGTILHWRLTKQAQRNVNFTAFCDDDHPRKTSSPILSPRSCGHLCFDCHASSLRYSGRRSLMDSSLDVRIAKKQIGPDVEAAIGDTSCADVVLGSWRR
jgi:hypothetical protein